MQACWFLPVIPGLESLKWEDQEFKVILDLKNKRNNKYVKYDKQN